MLRNSHARLAFCAGTIICNALMACGCVSLHGYSSVSALRQDALAVFQEQNQTTSSVMMLLAEMDPAEPTTLALAEAEAAMLAACEPLNEMAVALREDRKPSGKQRRRLPASIDACRQAAARTRELLDAVP